MESFKCLDIATFLGASRLFGCLMFLLFQQAMVLLSHLYVFLITQWCLQWWLGHGTLACFWPACWVGRDFWDSSALLGASNEEQTCTFSSRVKEKVPPDLYHTSNFLETPHLGQLETCAALHQLQCLVALPWCCHQGYNGIMMLLLLLE